MVISLCFLKGEYRFFCTILREYLSGIFCELLWWILLKNVVFITFKPENLFRVYAGNIFYAVAVC